MIRFVVSAPNGSRMLGTPLMNPSATSDTRRRSVRARTIRNTPSLSAPGRHSPWAASKSAVGEVASGFQWLVPSEKVILFQTLYLPDGRDIGMRLISANVAAS